MPRLEQKPLGQRRAGPRLARRRVADPQDDQQHDGDPAREAVPGRPHAPRRRR